MLGLSYDELPCYIKPCFFYFASYPEDFGIDVKPLCHMLIAEGFISLNHQKRSTETIEDIPYEYLSELVDRHMIQVQKRAGFKWKKLQNNGLCIVRFFSPQKITSSRPGVTAQETCFWKEFWRSVFIYFQWADIFIYWWWRLDHVLSQLNLSGGFYLWGSNLVNF